eukprot:Skav215644  [mRNA]  locus=scaffold736:335904:342984:- [translate_table: standard]
MVALADLETVAVRALRATSSSLGSIRLANPQAVIEKLAEEATSLWSALDINGTPYGCGESLMGAFQFVEQLYDSKGRKMKQIAESCQGKVRARGEGSGYLEHGGYEARMPLTLYLSCPPENFEEGRREVRRHLDDLQKKFFKFCSNHGRLPKCDKLYKETIRDPMSSSGWTECE